MTIRDEINNTYFEWMYDLVCANRHAKDISYRKLLMLLHSTEFTYSIPKDGNRAEDGTDLRRRFASQKDLFMTELDYLDGPCSVLEMMIALAIRCEENIMDDPAKGDRTGQWFWNMVVNLELGAMIDSRFDKSKATDILYRFLDRQYEPNGKGGLFTLKYSKRDLRKVEIWHQMCWYLDERYYY